MISMKEKIENKINKAFQPTHLEVVNESAKHSGHTGDDGSGDSHYVIKIRSDKFERLSRLDCQRLLHRELKDEMKIIHSLSFVFIP